jgi:hypothetical protein
VEIGHVSNHRLEMSIVSSETGKMDRWLCPTDTSGKT